MVIFKVMNVRHDRDVLEGCQAQASLPQLKSIVVLLKSLHSLEYVLPEEVL